MMNGSVWGSMFYSLSLWQLPAWHVSLTIGKKILLLCQIPHFTFNLNLFHFSFLILEILIFFTSLLVSLTIGMRIKLLCQCHFYWPSYVTFNWSFWHNCRVTEDETSLVNFSTLHWSMHWLEDFSLAALVGGFKRGTDTVTVMEHHKNWVVMHQLHRFWSIWLFWPIWLLANLNNKSLTQSNRAQDYPGWVHKVYPSSVPRSRMKIHTER